MHGNLANYLDQMEALEEAARHRLTAIVYNLVMGQQQNFANNLHNLAIPMREVAASGGRYELPRLAELLTRPEFEPLQRTLMGRGVALDVLQAEIDQQVEAVRREVGDSSTASPP